MKGMVLTAWAAALLVSVSCAAQEYPTRRITLLAGYSAGGPVDLAARLVAERLRDAG
jgi:tripartite-type tricarboxylate transporter receptor subunit TctC